MRSDWFVQRNRRLGRPDLGFIGFHAISRSRRAKRKLNSFAWNRGPFFGEQALPVQELFKVFTDYASLNSNLTTKNLSKRLANPS